MDGDNVTNDFRRALLSIGDNSFYNYWGTPSYGTDTFKRCLIEDIWDLYHFAYNVHFRHYLKTLTNLLTAHSLSFIRESFEPAEDTPNWKIRLIREPKLLDNYNQSRYFGVTRDNKACYLFLNKKRPSSREDCYKVK
jgi:hypothetical protein